MPLADTSKKNLVSRFCDTPLLENQAPVQAGARFSRNHSVQKKPKKVPFLDAFGHQNPPKVDFGTTLKIPTK